MEHGVFYQLIISTQLGGILAMAVCLRETPSPGMVKLEFLHYPGGATGMVVS